MTAPLSPLVAAKMARGVYGIRSSTEVRRGMMDAGGGGLGDNWDLSQEASLRATGVSGGAGITKKSGFGLVLKGQNSRSGEMAVLVRGTKIFPYDFITDAMFAVDRGPTGLGNHAGFHRVYKTMIDQVKTGIGSFDGAIHVVGHSLGGAIAHIIAARLHMDGHRNLKLYTFGSPRPGLPGFSSYLTTALGTENIYRAYSLADPIAMVPIFPFKHVPHAGDGIRVGSSLARITMTDHYMTSYQPLVDNATWRGLRTASNNVNNLRSIDYWLDQAQITSAVPLGGSTLWALGKAMSLILSLAGKVLGLAALGLATVVDTIAYLVTEAARISREISSYIWRFVRIVFKWAGKAISSDEGQMTAHFLAYVLKIMIAPVTYTALRALDAVYS